MKLTGPFHKTLPKSGLKMQWISVSFYEIGECNYFISLLCEDVCAKLKLLEDLGEPYKKNLHS